MDDSFYAPAPFIPVRGEGSRLWDQQGEKVYRLRGWHCGEHAGPCAPGRLREALNEQASKFWHTGNGYTNEPVLRLAKKLIDATFADRVFFCHSGAEANEAALKLARKFADRYGSHKSGIVAFKNAFHGRTLFTVSAGGQPAYSQDFAPLPPDIRHAAYNDINSASALIDDSTCAVIVEPIQGEGGVVPASNAFLQVLCVNCVTATMRC
ncbi:aminotransferase class III-fold pyridoxal phosphate-dependent enzyme [Escherichia coli]